MKILTFDRLLRIFGPYIVGPLETKTPLKMQVPTCLFLNGRNTNEEPAGREPAILQTQCAQNEVSVNIDVISPEYDSEAEYRDNDMHKDSISTEDVSPNTDKQYPVEFGSYERVIRL
ncbi:hypothetical protein ACJJTC_006778 [Scirpophaga incertulas]